jgi:hypothetical protein
MARLPKYGKSTGEQFSVFICHDCGIVTSNYSRDQHNRCPNCGSGKYSLRYCNERDNNVKTPEEAENYIIIQIVTEAHKLTELLKKIYFQRQSQVKEV